MSSHSFSHAHIQTPSPRAGVTAGYGDPVIFADGTFIDGSTAELSADGPIRPPFVVYCQVIQKQARALLASTSPHAVLLAGTWGMGLGITAKTHACWCSVEGRKKCKLEWVDTRREVPGRSWLMLVLLCAEAKVVVHLHRSAGSLGVKARACLGKLSISPICLTCNATHLNVPSCSTLLLSPSHVPWHAVHRT